MILYINYDLYYSLSKNISMKHLDNIQITIIIPCKSIMATIGALDVTAPSTCHGYRERNQAANEPAII